MRTYDEDKAAAATQFCISMDEVTPAHIERIKQVRATNKFNNARSMAEAEWQREADKSGYNPSLHDDW